MIIILLAMEGVMSIKKGIIIVDIGKELVKENRKVDVENHLTLLHVYKRYSELSYKIVFYTIVTEHQCTKQVLNTIANTELTCYNMHTHISSQSEKEILVGESQEL